MTQHQVAIVTGASGGVGQAVALTLAERGVDLLLTGRSAEKLQATAAQVHGVRCETLVADLLADDAAGRLVEAAVARLGRLDVIAAVAGDAPLGPIEKITPSAWRRTMDANVSHVAYLVAAAWPVWRRQKSGLLAAVSSMASFDPFPGFAMYAPAKAALNMWVHCVGSEGKKIGVRAVGVAPGAIETPMLRANFNEKLIPTEQCLDPYEVAAVLCDCITGQRDFESGQTIPMPSP